MYYCVNNLRKFTANRSLFGSRQHLVVYFNVSDTNTRLRKNVALIVETSNAYARGILHGIRDFLNKEPGWSIFLAEHSRHESVTSFPENWDGDGVIARIETETIAGLVRRMRIPTVDVSAARLIRGIPWVETDDESIAALAFDHLVSCGLRNLAFFGDPAYNWSKWRAEHFEKIVTQNGLGYSLYNLPKRTESQPQWYSEWNRIYEWLSRLPKPVGIFACYDAWGQQLLEVCRYFGFKVPDEVAVIGVDDDELLCDLSYPSLTSIALNARQTGYMAASLLDRMMSGEPPVEQKYSIKPIGVEKRVSTDLMAVSDPYVARAIAYIRERYMENIQVEDLLRCIPLSRRVLESRFRQMLNRTPHEEIVRVRVEYIKKRLAKSDDQLAVIADEMGFSHPEYLSVVFKKETGMTPSEYRNQTSRFVKKRIEAIELFPNSESAQRADTSS
ncbi:MAG: helix-turn-helix domain-containing protein [Spirochaetaceae bacterium]|nr:MAG: helix-turn-helix domain-containing protein [Spirochaetaceae bacterium]